MASTRFSKVWGTIVLLLIVMLFCPLTYGSVIYVDEDANGINDGSSWENAYWCLKDALANAQSGNEIRVAKGIYKPDQWVVLGRFGYLILSSGIRTETFQLINGVSLKGGYAGVDANDPNLRDIELYETILSGDLSGNDINVNEPNDLFEEPTRAENSYHVVTGIGTDETAILDGFIIAGGNANGPWESIFSAGGGMYNENCSLTVSNCVFIGNSSINGGGGVCNESSSPSFSYCDFEGNASDGSGGGMGNGNGSAAILKYCTFTANSAGPCGGALENAFNSYANLQNCTFIGNSAGGGGGAMENTESGQVTTSIIGCTFIGNGTNDLGGGVLTVRSNCVIVNSLFVENRAIGDRGWGGALHAAEATVTVVNCTFTGNTASNGSSLACSPEFLDGSPSNVTMTNSILWDDGSTIWSNDDSDITINYSNVQIDGGMPWPGEGNIKTDPLFADPENSDFHLKSSAGRWDPNSQSWVLDDVNSPCIDTGDPNCPVAFEPYLNGIYINMGAYGGTAEASKSPSGLNAKYGYGTGDPNNPYLIYNAEQLNTLGAEPNDYDKYFKLMADIDLSGYLYDRAVIAPDVNEDKYLFQGTFFTGVFNGNDYTISNITIEGKDYVGLFGQTGSGVSISNLGLEAVDVNGTGDSIGGLVGENSGSISNCYSNGTVTGFSTVGGLAGYNGGSITSSYSSGTVSGDRIVGGLVGLNGYTAGFFNCYSTGTVSGDIFVGGLVGWNEGEVTNCYNTGSVSGNVDVGGLIGENKFFNPFSSREHGIINESFWDMQVSGISDGVGDEYPDPNGVVCKTTAEMQTESTFTDSGWDFINETVNGTEDIWWILEGQDYPRLWWELIPEY